MTPGIGPLPTRPTLLSLVNRALTIEVKSQLDATIGLESRTCVPVTVPAEKRSLTGRPFSRGGVRRHRRAPKRKGKVCPFI